MSLPSHSQPRCCVCRRTFGADEGLREHLLHSAIHQPRNTTQSEDEGSAQPQRIGCHMCKRTFKNKTFLEQHQDSMRHRPLCDIPCLASGKCKKRFHSPSAHLHHLESGACPSKITKSRINAAIVKNDVNGIFTSTLLTKSLLEQDGSENSTASPLLTPTSTEFFDSFPSTAIHTPKGSCRSSMLFDGTLGQQFDSQPRFGAGRKRCPICPPIKTRTFEPGALQQHLSSSVHAKVQSTFSMQTTDEISFHCPLALMEDGKVKTPLKHFSTFSGLAQHIESGACQGGREALRRVVDYMREEMSSLELGGIRVAELTF